MFTLVILSDFGLLWAWMIQLSTLVINCLLRHFSFKSCIIYILYLLLPDYMQRFQQMCHCAYNSLKVWIVRFVQPSVQCCVFVVLCFVISVTSQAPALSVSLQGSLNASTSLSSVVGMANQAGRLNTSVVVAMDTSRLASLTIPSNFAAGDGEWMFVFGLLLFCGFGSIWLQFGSSL